MKQKPEALGINSLRDIKKSVLLLRNCSCVILIIDPLPCIIHIKSSKQSNVLLYVDCANIQKK